MTVDFLNAFDFFTGVPDSQLKGLCAYLYDKYGTSGQHIVAANEGNAVALAAGYHLATGKTPVVYLQNSGLGNIVNPVASLMNGKVSGIPCLFIIGWRGEPGVHDEPQHIFQGEITLGLLEQLEIPSFIIDKHTSLEQVQEKLSSYQAVFREGRQAAFVVCKDALDYKRQSAFTNQNTIVREEAISHILHCSNDSDIFVSTTGMISRELFELRTLRGQSHHQDFLTVGAMGHSSSIALKIALEKRDRRVWCLDGDGAVLMHMGSLAVIGSQRPENLIHIVLNNQAHESVGGVPTAAGQIDLCGIAHACGYTNVMSVDDPAKLDDALEYLQNQTGLAFLEIRTALGFRKDLGRPSHAPVENRRIFMDFLLQ